MNNLILSLRSFEKSSYIKFSKFILGGGLNFFLKVCFTILLTEYLKLPYFTSYIIILSILAASGFFYNAYITFSVKKGRFANFTKYLVASLTFNFLDASLVKIATEFFGLYYLFSIILVSITIFTLKFFVYDRFVFIDEKTTGRKKHIWELL